MSEYTGEHGILGERGEFARSEPSAEELRKTWLEDNDGETPERGD